MAAPVRPAPAAARRRRTPPPSARLRAVTIAALAAALGSQAASAQNVATLRGCADGVVAADSHVYYAIDVVAAVDYCFHMEGSGESDLDLWLHNINVEVLARDVSESPNGTILARFDRDGRYFLRVENNQHPTSSRYRLCEALARDTSRCN